VQAILSVQWPTRAMRSCVDGSVPAPPYVTHYNLCRVREALRTTPGVAHGIAERVSTIGDLLDATLGLEPNRPVRVARNFQVIDGGKA
jgi:hypothetical protein